MFTWWVLKLVVKIPCLKHNFSSFTFTSLMAFNSKVVASPCFVVWFVGMLLHLFVLVPFSSFEWAPIVWLLLALFGSWPSFSLLWESLWECIYLWWTWLFHQSFHLISFAIFHLWVWPLIPQSYKFFPYLWESWPKHWTIWEKNWNKQDNFFFEN